MGFFERLFRGEAARNASDRADREAYEERLRTPRWDKVEAVLGRPVPAILRDLYEDQMLVTRDDLLVFDPRRPRDRATAWNINQFTPADEEALAPELDSIPPGAFAFATNQFGDPFYVQIGEFPDGDGRVFVHHHDGDDTELVAPSLRSFLSWNREQRTKM